MRKIVAALLAGFAMAAMGSGLTLSALGHAAGLWVVLGGWALILSSHLVRKGRI